MMKLREAVLFGCGLVVAVGLMGCGSSFGRTAAERAHTYKTITRFEWRMAKDDFDNFMLMDGRSRLTRWH